MSIRHFFGLFFLLLFFVLHPNAQTVPDYVPLDSLKGWWPFTGNAIDSSGNGVDGTVNGAVLTSDRFGNANSAYSYYGSANSIVFSNYFQFHRSGDASISFWVDLGTLTNFAQQASLVKSSLSGINDYDRFNFFVRIPTGIVLDYRENNPNMSTNLHTLNVKSNFPSNVWTHVVYVRSAKVYKLYLNGKYVNSVTDKTPNLPVDTGWLIGDDPIGDLDFAGKIDDMGLWARALTDCEIYHLYKASLWQQLFSFDQDTVVFCGHDSVLIEAEPGFVSYQWSNAQTGSSVYMQNAQTLSLICVDSATCVSYDTISVLTSSPKVKIVENDSVTCFGLSDAKLYAKAYNGTLPYSYLWNNAATSDSLINMPKGDYFIELSDSFACKDTAYASVGEPDELVIKSRLIDSVTCFGGKDAKAAVDFSGGVVPYVYHWNNGAVGDSLAQLKAGVYTFYLKDAHNCSDSLIVDIGEPDKLAISLLNSDTVSCYGKHDGRLSVKVNGGVPPYTYQWNDAMNQRTAIADSLMAGIYKVMINDYHGCVDSLIAEVDEPDDLKAVILEVDSTSCFGMQDGKIIASVTGGVMPYTYQWNTNPVQYTIDANSLGKGRYTLSVTDAHSCMDTVSAQVFENNLPITVNIICKTYVIQGEVVELTTDVNGPETIYNWSPSDQFGLQVGLARPHIKIENSMQVAVDVTNNKGCKGSDTADIIVILPLSKWVPSAFSPNHDGVNDYFGLPDFFEISEFDIFNRWGEQLFKGSADHPFWDGSYKGELVEAGMYLYIIRAHLKGDTKNFEVKGMVLILE